MPELVSSFSLGIDLAERIQLGYELTSHQSWPTYDGKELDRSKFVTSSEVEQCLRRIKFRKVMGKQGFPNWGYAERGNIIEEWVVSKLTAGGVNLKYAGKNQVSFYDTYQSGTPDGLIDFRDGYWLKEFKSVDPRTNYSNLPKLDHRSQVQQNIELVQVCLKKPVYGGTIFYVDASNLQKTKQFDVAPDHSQQARLEERAHKVMTAASPSELPTEGMLTGDCDRCEFVEQCNALVAGDLSSLERATNGHFNTRK